MNWSALKGEWGAISFVLTVLIGVIVVPIALYLAGQTPAPVSFPSPSPSAASGPREATSPRAATPAGTNTPTPSPSKSP